MERAKQSWHLAGILTALALLLAVVLVWTIGLGFPVHADLGILYVDGASGSDGGNNCANGGSPCATIAHAIDQAGPADDIWVAQGTYEETLDIGKNLLLKGGYEAAGWTRDIGANPTVIDAKGADASVISIYPAATAEVEGFTIQGANHTSDWGGGIYVNTATVVISATIVQNNKTSGGGGGIWIEEMEAGSARLKVVNSTVRNNQAGSGGGGVLGSPGTEVSIVGSQIMDNSATDGGGGIESGGDPGRTTTLTIDDSILANNEAGLHGGALTVFHGTANLTNVLAHGNASSEGPASVLMSGDSNVSVMNSTFADNNPQGHQAFNLHSTNLDMANSVMWNNALNIQAEAGCTDCVKVDYSDVEGECSWCDAGQGNISTDPRFVNAASDNYRLAVGSPCIDKGTPAGAPAADIEGTPRDGAPDMGAYEWIGYRMFLPAATRNLKP
jgi:hypothetical protein